MEIAGVLFLLFVVIVIIGGIAAAFKVFAAKRRAARENKV